MLVQAQVGSLHAIPRPTLPATLTKPSAGGHQRLRPAQHVAFRRGGYAELRPKDARKPVSPAPSVSRLMQAAHRAQPWVPLVHQRPSGVRAGPPWWAGRRPLPGAPSRRRQAPGSAASAPAVSGVLLLACKARHGCRCSGSRTLVGRPPPSASRAEPTPADAWKRGPSARWVSAPAHQTRSPPSRVSSCALAPLCSCRVWGTTTSASACGQRQRGSARSAGGSAGVVCCEHQATSPSSAALQQQRSGSRRPAQV